MRDKLVLAAITLFSKVSTNLLDLMMKAAEQENKNLQKMIQVNPVGYRMLNSYEEAQTAMLAAVREVHQAKKDGPVALMSLLREQDFPTTTVLDYEYAGWSLGKCTVRHYLVELARRCWLEADDFSGKRPLGRSGWKFDVYAALVAGGFVEGTFDSDGDLNRVDRTQADEIIAKCFEQLQKG